MRFNPLHVDVPNMQRAPLAGGIQSVGFAQTSQRRSPDRGFLRNLRSVLAYHRPRACATCRGARALAVNLIQRVQLAHHHGYCLQVSRNCRPRAQCTLGARHPRRSRKGRQRHPPSRDVFDRKLDDSPLRRCPLSLQRAYLPIPIHSRVVPRTNARRA